MSHTEIKPEEILSHANDDEWLKQFIIQSGGSDPSHRDKYNTASTIFLGRKVRDLAVLIEACKDHFVEILPGILKGHSGAISKSAEAHANALTDAVSAADRHTRQLVLATWALCGATVVLAIIALVPLLKT